MPHTYQSTIVDAPIEKVWAAVRNFHDISWAPNVITKMTPVGDRKGDEIGAQRVLNDVFHETLTALDDSERIVKYSIDDGPPPVSKDDVKNYVGDLRLRPITDESKTFVEWSSRWEAVEPDAVEFCHGIYVALLKDLKNTFA